MMARNKTDSPHQPFSENQDYLYDLFTQAPAAIAVVRGKDYVFQFANGLYLQLTGKNKDIIGISVRKAFPELEGQGFFELLDTVYETGEPFIGNEMPIEWDVNGDGKMVKNYLNFVYQPLKNTNGETYGIMAHAVNVTEQVESHRRVQESEERYRALFNGIDQGFCVIEMLYDKRNKPVDYLFLEVNSVFHQQTGLKDVIGKTVRQLVPQQERYWFEIYGKVATTGEPVRFDNQAGALNRWYDVYATRIGGDESRRVAVLFKDITENKKAEAALKDSEERFRTLIEKSTDAIQLVSAQGEIIYTSESIKNVLGYTAEELEGLGVAPFIHPDDLAGFTAALTKLATGAKRSVSLQYRVKHKDGSWAWLETTGVNHLDTPNINALVGTFRNTTKRKQAEEALRASQSQLSAVFESVADGIAVYDTGGNIILLNKAQAMINGYKNVDDMKLNLKHLAKVYQFSYPDGKVCPLKDWPVSRVYRGEIFTNFELKGKRTDINREWFFNFSGAPVYDDEGKMSLAVVVTRDVTAQKQAEEKFRYQSYLNSLIMSNTTTGLLILDDKQYCKFMNPAAERIIGYSFKKIQRIDKPLHDIVHHTKPDGTPYPISECPIGRASPAKANTHGEDVFVRPDGSFYPVALTASPIIENDKPVGTVIEILDITDAKRAREEQDRLAQVSRERNELLQVNEAKDEFVSIASHQLRTPATAVKQYLSILLDGYGGPLNDNQTRYLKTAYDSNERQLNLINDLLKTAQMGSTSYKLNRNTYDISRLIQNTLDELSDSFAMQNQKVISRGLGQVVLAEVDATEFKLALANLLENACKYSHKGSKIVVDLVKREDRVSISVADKGVGISKDKQKDIFDKFTRVDNELSDTITGTGLGLYWVKRIVELHGGKVDVRSELKKGSKFTINLPL